MNTRKRIRTVLILAAATAILILATAPANADLIDNLVEYWELDGDYAAVVTEDHVGTLTTSGTGSGTFVAGKFKQAIDLENSSGNQAFIEIGGDENDFDFAAGGESFSVSVWYTTESLYTSWQALLAKGEGSGWRLHRNSGDATNLNWNAGGRGTTGNGKLDQQDGSWHHVAATLEDGVGIKLYVDGAQVASNNNTVTPEDRGNPMQIGGNPDAGGRGWDGNIDDVAVWNRVLTPEEVELIWNNGDGETIGNLTGLSDPMRPSPEDGEKVLPGDVELSWTNMDPVTPGGPVYVDVYFGADPNELSLIVDATAPEGENATAVTVSAPILSGSETQYYWQVNSYINGSPTGDPNEGSLYTFYAADLPPSSVDAGVDMITWYGQGVQLDPTVEDDGVSALTYLWSADPAAGVAFDSDSIANPIVTITGRNLVRGIQAEADDVEEHVNTQAISGAVPQGTMGLTSSDLELGSEGDGGLDWQVIAVQYNQLGIPQGSTITSAKLTFQVDNSGAAGTSNDFTILAEAADDASVFNTDLNNITDRARSAASVAWAPDWGTGPVVGTKVDTPDITTLIQEVVDRAGWSDNNRLTLMIYPDVYLASPTGGTTTVQEIEFEANPGSDSATLTVTYDPPAGSPLVSAPSTVTVTVEVTDDVGSIAGTMMIDVYDDPCKAAIGAGLDPIEQTDHDGNCITGLEDLLRLVAVWLDDYWLTEPFVKP